MTALSFFYWVFLLVGPYQAEWFVSRNLELSEMSFDPKLREKEVRKFVTGYLKSDGIFVCRMVTIHSGVIMGPAAVFEKLAVDDTKCFVSGTEVVLGLWRSFYGIEAKIHNHESDDSTDSEGKKTGNETSAAPIKLRSIAKWKEKESIEEKA